MKMGKNNRFFSLDSAHEKFDVWNGPGYFGPIRVFDSTVNMAREKHLGENVMYGT